MNSESLFEEFLARLKEDFGDAIQKTDAEWDALKHYVAIRVAHLAEIIGEPGYDLAVKAERDAIALKAGITAVHMADAAGQRWVGIVQGGIVILAKAVALNLTGGAGDV